MPDVRRRVPLLSLAVLLSVQAAGADAVAPVPAGLALHDVIDRSIATNRDLRTARSVLLQARLGRRIATTSVYAPTLSTEYTAYNGQGDNGDGRIALTSKALGFEIEPYLRLGYVPHGREAVDPLRGDDGYSTAAGISIGRRLFAISEHINQRLPITEADLAIYSAANNLVIAGRDLERRATESFFAVQSADTRLGVRERRLADAKEFLATVRDRIAHGFASPLDGLYAEIDLNQAEADLIADRTSLATSKERLNDLLDRPVTTPIAIVPEVIDDARVAAIPVRDLTADTAAVLAGHESLGTAAKQAELLALQLRVQRDNLWPDVHAALAAERRADGPTPFDGRDQVGNVVALTVTWNMPLDGWRAARAGYEQIGKRIEDQDRAAAGQRSSLETRLRDAWRQIDAQRRQVSLAVRRLDIERLRLDATLRRYETGTVDNLEVTRAKQAVDNAEIALLDARVSLVLGDAAYRALLPMTPTPLTSEAPEARSADKGEP